MLRPGTRGKRRQVAERGLADLPLTRQLRSAGASLTASPRRRRRRGRQTCRLRWEVGEGDLRRRDGRARAWEAGRGGRTQFGTVGAPDASSDTSIMQPAHLPSAVTASLWATPPMELARCGATQLLGGRPDLAPRLAGVFRARRDDGSGAGGLRRRQAEKCRQIGWYTARLLRLLAAGVPPAG